jgi:2-(1,2-epoxy-1,2-dihydrophenyl)acetyl-CoA isomerase
MARIDAIQPLKDGGSGSLSRFWQRLLFRLARRDSLELLRAPWPPADFSGMGDIYQIGSLVIQDHQVPSGATWLRSGLRRDGETAMANDYSTLRFERDGAVATLTLCRPQTGNAIELQMARDLLQASIAADRDGGIRAVVLQSEGHMFCAGGDLNAFAAAEEDAPALMSEVTAILHAAIARLARMDKPLIVGVQGFAAGAGFSLAMLGDIVIASRSAQFTLAYTGIGLTPDGGASWLLPRLVGLRKAQQLILSNTRLAADEALEIGLVTEVVADDVLQGCVRDWAMRLAEGPTKAFARSRNLLLDVFGETFEAHLERESRAIVESCGGMDGQDGIAAFLAKRRPTFSGKS